MAALDAPPTIRRRSENHQRNPKLLAALIAIPLLLIWVLTLVDLVRRHDLNGSRKVLWALVVLFVPVVGVIVYELYILRVAYAPGAAGRLARVVKLADLDDHLARPWHPGDPPYAWARRHVAVARARVDYSSSRPSARARPTASERDDASSLR
jgi:Phospholipase_D-nuclease N-terminal